MRRISASGPSTAPVALVAPALTSHALDTRLRDTSNTLDTSYTAATTTRSLVERSCLSREFRALWRALCATIDAANRPRVVCSKNVRETAAGQFLDEKTNTIATRARACSQKSSRGIDIATVDCGSSIVRDSDR